MRGKGIFVREEVGLSVKGKGASSAEKDFPMRKQERFYPKGEELLSQGEGNAVRKKKELCAQVKETLSVGKLTCVGRRILFRAQSGKFLCARK